MPQNKDASELRQKDLQQCNEGVTWGVTNMQQRCNEGYYKCVTNV